MCDTRQDLCQSGRSDGLQDVPELADRLRKGAEGRFRLPGNPEGMGLTDVLVHSADAFRAVGLDLDAPPVDAAPALNALWKTDRVVHAVPGRVESLTSSSLAIAGPGPSRNLASMTGGQPLMSERSGHE